MTLKNIIRQWQYQRFRKHLFDDRFYQPLLSCKHMVWGDGTIGLEPLIIEDYTARLSELAFIRDQVVAGGWNWDMYGIVDANAAGAITDRDLCVVFVNIGEDIKYL